MEATENNETNCISQNRHITRIRNTKRIITSHLSPPSSTAPITCGWLYSRDCWGRKRGHKLVGQDAIQVFRFRSINNSEHFINSWLNDPLKMEHLLDSPIVPVPPELETELDLVRVTLNIVTSTMGFRDCLESCEIEKPRNLCISAVSGFIFSLAWWIAIDAAFTYSNVELPGAYHAPGAIGTLAFLLVNIIPNSALRDDYGERLIGRRASFVCLFFAFLMAFSCVIAACWILFGAYVAAQSQTVWPGVAIFLQNVLLCASSFIFRFGRKVDD